MNATLLQPVDLTTLRAVLAELRPPLLPSRFEKAQQPTPHSLQLGLRSQRGLHWLEISWQAEAPRLLAIDSPPRQGQGSTLAQQLQHGLAGLALVAIEQTGWERVVELQFAARPGEPCSRCLIIELMGRRSNLFLLDGQRRVIALARQVRQQQSRLRPIGSGDLYSPPPALQGDLPSRAEGMERWRRRLSLVPVSLQKALQQTYQGISPALALQLAGDQPEQACQLLAMPVNALEEHQWQELWCQWQRWLTDLEQERFGFASGPSHGRVTAYRCWGTEAPAAGVNAALAAYYGPLLARQEAVARRLQLEQRLLAARARQQRQRDQQQALLDQVENTNALQRQADALLCGLSPSRGEISEAQSLYKRARRLRRSVAAITPRLELHDRTLEQIDSSLTFLEQHADQADDLLALEQDIEALLDRGSADQRARQRRPAPPKAQATPQPLELRTPGGLRVQVGRNHRQNDWISLSQARRGDLWFHAQECPGSHVILKSSEAPAGEQDLQAAADLAAHFSRARGNRRVAVVMVPSDQLQRIAGAGPGTVRHRGGEVVWGDPGRGAPLVPSLGARSAP
ncbi:NFACT family protein [Synechococcus sp. CS-603]|uniref:Rqc2 family fibronectin-binding protein n=1 Tax=Synechococcus sp. CS-603 TaxID=2847981 RepID=UPI00223A6F04|nr:NFACT family protein [Synechococcus sp. CS-603]MCT0202586.1 NFACT family protein [Synechococcus sp. CS-603]